jgi:hypothetical protein
VRHARRTRHETVRVLLREVVDERLTDLVGRESHAGGFSVER